MNRSVEPSNGYLFGAIHYAVYQDENQFAMDEPQWNFLRPMGYSYTSSVSVSRDKPMIS